MAEFPNVHPAIKLSVFVGIFLVRILDGTPWLWGNLSVYVSSYYYATGRGDSRKSVSLVLGLDVTGFNMGILVGGLLSRKFGITPVLFTAVLTSCASILLSNALMQYSVTMLCISFGLIPGLCAGIVEACQLSLAVRWTRKYRGLATSSIPSLNILGAVVMNMVLTMFINPSNHEPDIARDKTRLFSQPDVIEKVPQAFTLLGCVSFVVGVTGLLLIRERPGKDNNIVELYHRFVQPDTEKIRLTASTGRDGTDQSNLSQPDQHSTSYSGTTAGVSQIVPDGETFDDDVTPKQALRLREFYALSIHVAVETYSFFILNTYYKSFGFVHIPDDHFLTVAVMVKCFCTPVCAVMAGYAVDKLGLKLTMVTTTSIFCVVSSLFYPSASDKWLFMVAFVVYGCFLFSLFCLTGTCCVKIFGESHFTTIFGMLLAPTYILTPCMPLLSDWIITTSGWLVLFTSVSVLACFDVINLIWNLPEKTIL